jgi:hypothetical protein
MGNAGFLKICDQVVAELHLVFHDVPVLISSKKPTLTRNLKGMFLLFHFRGPAAMDYGG